MKKIFCLIIFLLLLTGCQSSQPKKEGIITNQYHFYQDSINKAQNAQQQLGNISVNVNEN